MSRFTRSPIVRLAPLALAAALSGWTPAGAQAPALPTAPGAERAGNGGLTQAHASLPAAPGLSPLEPYLITWLLPVSGILTLFAGIWSDRQIRARQFRRR